MRKCSICEHPKYKAITGDLVRKVAYRELENRYGVSKSAVERHASHSRTELQRAIEREESSGDAAAIMTIRAETLKVKQETQELYYRALDILAAAENAEDRQDALAAIREARSNLRLYAELSGELNPRSGGEVPGAPVTVIVQYVDKAVVLSPTEAQRLNGARPDASGGHSTETAGNVLMPEAS